MGSTQCGDAPSIFCIWKMQTWIHLRQLLKYKYTRYQSQLNVRWVGPKKIKLQSFYLLGRNLKISCERKILSHFSARKSISIDLHKSRIVLNFGRKIAFLQEKLVQTLNWTQFFLFLEKFLFQICNFFVFFLIFGQNKYKMLYNAEIQ